MQLFTRIYAKGIHWLRSYLAACLDYAATLAEEQITAIGHIFLTTKRTKNTKSDYAQRFYSSCSSCASWLTHFFRMRLPWRPCAAARQETRHCKFS